ncbi:MAG TPA: ATP-binding protein [Actinomycetota bacterium]
MGRKQAKPSLLIGAVALGGAVLLVGAGLAIPRFDPGLVRQAGILLVLTAVAELVSIRVKHGDSAELLTLFELAVVADFVLLPAPIAILTAVGGLAVALAVHRRAPIKYAFNIGQYTLGLVPAAALYHLAGGDFDTALGVGALLTGMGVFTLVNLLTISAIIAAQSKRSLMDVMTREGPVSFAMGLGNSAVGIVAVALYLTRPLLLPAVLAPTIAMHHAFRGWVKQKELTAQMEEETRKLGRILEHSSEGIVLADADGIVLLWSPSMERMTGVVTSEAVGKALPYLLRGRDSVGRQVSIGASSAAGPVELEILATDGSQRWLRVQHGPGLDEKGQLTFDVLVVTDVTRQREVDRLKDDFFSTVSHELRTPLTPIRGYASLLLRRGDDIDGERRADALTSILQRAEHMGRLVEDMLLASKIANPSERRLPDVEHKPIDASRIVERVVQSFTTTHPTREFDTSDVAASALAVGDAMRFEQVLAHLLANAVKFSDEGTTVRVALQRRDTEVILTVRDEGRGIPADRQVEIFERFKRLEDPLRMETGGAGLGLFIVKQLAEAMGGSVAVQSELGVGSSFTVRLHAAAATRLEVARPPAPATGSEEAV